MIRNQKKFSEFGNVLQSKTLQPGETAEIFSLEMPKNYIGFIYYLANGYFPLKLNIDGEVVDVNIMVASIGSPKLFDPPYVVNKSIKVSAKNETTAPKTISFYADGIAYSALTISEEIFIKEIKGEKEELSQATLTSPVNVKEIIPTTAHIVNHNLNEADKWYEIRIPRDVVTWAITIRGSYEVKYSYSPTHQTYRTLRAGEILEADTAPSHTLNAIWVMSEDGGVVVELEVWKK